MTPNDREPGDHGAGNHGAGNHGAGNHGAGNARGAGSTGTGNTSESGRTGNVGDSDAPDTELALNSGAYVLNALDQAESAAFEAHLAESETTRDEVTELSDAAVLLGLAATPVQPSPQLKSNLMALLGSTPQLPREISPVRTIQPASGLAAAAGRTDEPGRTDEDAATDERGRTDEPRRTDEPGSFRADVALDAPTPAQSNLAAPLGLTAKARARWFNRPLVAITSIAAAILLIVGGTAFGNLLSNTSFEQQQADQLAAINSANDMQQTAAKVATGGIATLVWSEKLGKAAMIVKGMPVLPDSKTYELWVIDAKGAPTPAGTFDVKNGDNTWRVLEGKMVAGDTIGVTVEPSGGSKKPTTTPVVAITST
jgi:anti-sigma-K factor RskA